MIERATESSRTWTIPAHRSERVPQCSAHPNGPKLSFAIPLALAALRQLDTRISLRYPHLQEFSSYNLTLSNAQFTVHLCQQEKQKEKKLNRYARTSNNRLVGRRKKAERSFARNEQSERAQRLEVARLVAHVLVSGIAEVFAEVRDVSVAELIGERETRGARGGAALLEETPAARRFGNGEAQVDECTDFVRAAARLSGALINPYVLIESENWRRVRVRPAAQRACASSSGRRAHELEALRANCYTMYQE